MTRLARCVLPLALLLGVCGSSGPSTVAPSTAAATTSAAATSATSSVAVGTTAAMAPTTASTAASTTAMPTTGTVPVDTTVASTAATDPCPADATTDARSDGWPGRLSGLVGVDARLGRHPCYERFVLEFGGTGGFPGWAVRYLALPVRGPASDLPIDLPGTAAIGVTVEAWMPDMEGNGYQGPASLDVTGYQALAAVRRTATWEGVTDWVLALDRVHPFRVLTLSDPPRLVVDVVTGDDGRSTAPTVATCEPFGGTGWVGTAGAIVFSLTGKELRVGRHDCYERIVLELRGDGPFPSWSVSEVARGYADDEGRSLPGSAYLHIWVAAGNTVPAPGPLGYDIAWTRPAPGAFDGYTALRGELYGGLGDEKDSSTFVVGLDRVRPFRAFTLTDPPRLVVDVATFQLVAAT